MNDTRRFRPFFRSWLLLLGILFSLTGCTMVSDGQGLPRAKETSKDNSAQSGSSSVSAGSDSGLRVHFIDVGQGDSILAESEGHFLLIDAGENDQGSTVVSYLKQAGVKKLDYVIGTHPHSDHIGGLDDVIRAFDVEKVILPPIEHTTKTFEDVLDAISDKGLKITKPVPGTSYNLGNASFTVIAPVKGKDYGTDLNNWSVGIRLTYGDNAFVLCGDAESTAEQDIVDSGAVLSADVLKAGHHGSSTSTSAAFLKKVSPTWAVIQCGKDNSYGHPHRETLAAFKKAGVTVFRTDELGTIMAVSDGSSISWSHITSSGQAESLSSASDTKGQSQSGGLKSASEAGTYILNTNTKKFHKPDCASVSHIQEENKKSFTGTRKELTDQGYAPCGQCKP